MRFNLIVALLIVSTNSFAQTPVEQLIRRAYELRREGHDEQALPVLEQAFRLDSSPRVAAQLGLCDQALGRWAEADRLLRIALAVPGDEWVARHLEGLEGAYALVLAHLPREASSAPVRTVVRIEHVHSVDPPERLAVRPDVPIAGLASVISGAVLGTGGVAAWIVREEIVQNFNGRGCRIGDPNLPAGCNVDGARSGRDIATSMAVTGLVTGGVLAGVGAALLFSTGRHHSERASLGVVGCGMGPGDFGISCGGRF